MSSNLSKLNFHSLIGHRITSEFGSNRGRIAVAVRHHHEHFDCSGYQMASGGQIPMLSLIISIADSYNAMSAPRS